MSLEPWTVTTKALHWCGSDNSSCLGPYPMVAFLEFHVSCRLGWEFFTLPTYLPQTKSMLSRCLVVNDISSLQLTLWNYTQMMQYEMQAIEMYRWFLLNPVLKIVYGMILWNHTMRCTTGFLPGSGKKLDQFMESVLTQHNKQFG